MNVIRNMHSTKSIQIRTFFWSVFFSIRTEYEDIHSDTQHLPVFSTNVGKYRSEKTPHLDTFHAAMHEVRFPNIYLLLDIIHYVFILAIIIILVIKTVGFSKARQTLSNNFAMHYGNIKG